MAQDLWKLEVAATALFTDPEFASLGRRQCRLSFSYEGQTADTITSASLVFQSVEAFRCTYLSSCSAEMFKQAYGRLVDLGQTPWLREILPLYTKFHRAYGQVAQDLRHLMICFDDGPCYEFICAGFRYSCVAEPTSASE